MREDHIASAVAFLKEPQVASAPLAKRVEFLESKGLTAEEINESLKRVQEETGQQSSSSVSAPPSSQKHIMQIPPRPEYMLQAPPPIPERDWKDYFVMATVSVGVAYGLYECARRYVLPMIMPPTPSSLEADKEALEAEFERTEQLVKQLQEDTAEIKQQEVARTTEFNRVMDEARSVILSIKEQSEERKQESKLALSNVETLRDLIPRALKQHSETQAQAVEELQNELKSLKQLLNRRQASMVGPQVPPASAVPSSLPGFPRKPKSKPDTDAKNERRTSPTEQITNTATNGDMKPETNINTGSSGITANTIQTDANPDSKPTAGSESKANTSANAESSFIPDPQAGIPEWQRSVPN